MIQVARKDTKNLRYSQANTGDFLREAFLVCV